MKKLLPLICLISSALHAQKAVQKETSEMPFTAHLVDSIGEIFFDSITKEFLVHYRDGWGVINDSLKALNMVFDGYMLNKDSIASLTSSNKNLTRKLNVTWYIIDKLMVIVKNLKTHEFTYEEVEKMWGEIDNAASLYEQLNKNNSHGNLER